MSDNISDIAELAHWYSLAKENKDKQQFYNYLYEYVGAVADSRQLMAAVNSLTIQEVLSDTSPNNKQLEVLREYVQTAKKQNGVTDAQQLAFQEDMFVAIETSRIKETQFSYCWFKLFNSFYNVYKHDLGTAGIQRVRKIDPTSIKATTKQEKDKLAEVRAIYEVQALDTKEMSEITQLNQTIANFAPSEGQSIYVTSLDIFNKRLLSHLEKSKSEVGERTTAQSHVPQQNPPQPEVVARPDDVLNLTISGKALWLVVNGEKAEKVKEFDSKSNNNFLGCRELLRRKGHPLSTANMGIAPKSRITDLPKTMGLVGAIADAFVDVDTKNNTITILKDVGVSHNDLPELIRYCKTQFSK